MSCREFGGGKINICNKINNLCAELSHKYKINCGGCCFIAYCISKLLKEEKIRYKLIIYGYISNCRPLLELRRDIKESNYSYFGSHYAIYVNNYGVINCDGYKYPSKKIIGCLSPEDIKNIYKSGRWNNTYKRVHNKEIEKCFKNLLKDEKK